MVRAWLAVMLVVTTALCSPLPSPDHPPAGGFGPLSGARGTGYGAPPAPAAPAVPAGPTKTIYVNVPQPAPAPAPQPIAAGPPRKHYKIVFIRSPAPPPPPQPILPPRTEQKTLIYVLYQRPKVDGPQVIEVPDVKHSPEVFFVQYDKPPTTEQLQQLSAGNLEGLSSPGTISLSGLSGAPAPINTAPPAPFDSAEVQISSGVSSLEDALFPGGDIATGYSSPDAALDSVFSGSAPAPSPVAAPAPLIDARVAASSAEVSSARLGPASAAPAAGIRAAVGGSVDVDSLSSESLGVPVSQGSGQASISPATQIAASFGVPLAATRTGANNVIDADINPSPGGFFLQTESVELDDRSAFGNRVPSIEVVSQEFLSGEQLDSLDDLDDQIGLGLLPEGNNVLAG